MSISKKRLYSVTHRLYEELRSNSNHVIIRKLHGGQGLYNYQTEDIVVDYRRTMISTLIHEYLHKWYPDKCETWVLDQERIIMNNLSTRQIKNIIYEFAKAIHK